MEKGNTSLKMVTYMKESILIVNDKVMEKLHLPLVEILKEDISKVMNMKEFTIMTKEMGLE